VDQHCSETDRVPVVDKPSAKGDLEAKNGLALKDVPAAKNGLALKEGKA
jgi:hypothetical protein